MAASRWQLPPSPLRWRAITATLVGCTTVVLLGWAGHVSLGLSGAYILRVALAFGVCMWTALGYLHSDHPFARFGPANYVTMLRLGLVTLLAGLLLERASPAIWTTASVLGLCALALDGLDGWLARRSGLAGRFGARFDMETDALLILVLSALVWIAGKAGPWVLLSGLLRYGFVAASWVFHWLRKPLSESRRRKAVCAVQIAALAVALLPIVPKTTSAVIAGLALGILAWSFLADVACLRLQQVGQPSQAVTTSTAAAPTVDRTRWSTMEVVAALVLLNASLTFENVWPTPGVRWGHTLSVEVSACILILAVCHGAALRLRRVLTGTWVLLVVGRYADVTAPSLYGREVNLYWDLPHAANVAEMLAQAAPLWLVAAVGVCGVLGVVLLYRLLYWCIARVSDAITRRNDRIILASVAGLSIAAFIMAPANRENSDHVGFSAPVTFSYARHLRLTVRTFAARGAGSVVAGPPLEADLSRLGGADVLLIFIESYGATAWERHEFATPLTAARDNLAAAIGETSRRVVSTYVESPTFGGSSWLAHISLMTGIEVRDAEHNALLMSETRDTVVKTFSREGYRTVAVMPGLWQSWPEGAFYGFDDIYGGARLDYHGPPFGWWDIPDQFALAKLNDLELRVPNRAPVFAFIPTVSTHAPFSPTPPYQPDWDRLLTNEPFNAEDVDRAWEQWADWLNLGPGYVRSIAYAYASIAGYIRDSRGRDFVMVLIGDHQPAAAVSGERASWDVPVHVVTRNKSILEHLIAAGFSEGLTPRPPSLGPMHTLLPALLDAFGGRPGHR